MTLATSALPIVYRGTCSSGECLVETYTEPFVTFKCHCSNCHRFSGKDLRTPSLFWLPAIRQPQGPVEYETTTVLMGLTGIKQSKCSKCRDLSVCSLGIRAYTGLVFKDPAFLTHVGSGKGRL